MEYKQINTHKHKQSNFCLHTSPGSICFAMVGTRTDKECINDLFEAKGTIALGHSGQIDLEFFWPVGGKGGNRNYSGGDMDEVFCN